MTGRPTILLIPSETRAREFDAKLLLACFGAERGYDCIVGSRMAMHQAVLSMPVGLYIAKDMAQSSAKMLGILRGLGHDVVGWDEESLVYLSEETYLRHRVSAETTRWIRRVFAWGEKDRTMRSRSEAFRGIPVEAVGNPRFDLLRPDLREYYGTEAAEIKRRHGRFVLVNSNFGRLNHLLPSQRLVPSQTDAAAYEAGPQSGLPFGYWQFRERVFNHFREMVPALAEEFPGIQIVLRPHPSEDHAPWRKLAGGRGNVTVTNEGPAIPWLLAAEAVIHNGCTTGLEAYLLGTPVLCFQPITDPNFDLALPNGVSDPAGSLPELLSLTSAILGGHHVPRAENDKRALAGRYIEALDGPLSCERILDAIERHLQDCPPVQPTPLERRTAAWRAWKRSVRKRMNALFPRSKNAAWYTRARFADTRPAELMSRIAIFAALLGRFDGIRVEQIRPNIFRVARR